MTVIVMYSTKKTWETRIWLKDGYSCVQQDGNERCKYQGERTREISERTGSEQNETKYNTVIKLLLLF